MHLEPDSLVRLGFEHLEPLEARQQDVDRRVEAALATVVAADQVLQG